MDAPIADKTDILPRYLGRECLNLRGAKLLTYAPTTYDLTKLATADLQTCRPSTCEVAHLPTTNLPTYQPPTCAPPTCAPPTCAPPTSDLRPASQIEAADALRKHFLHQKGVPNIQTMCQLMHSAFVALLCPPHLKDTAIACPTDQALLLLALAGPASRQRFQL
ncbi:hypothetical protein BDN71DRAFT_1513914 [Pleurotus eryngii]|uniref:Uncharacterized protein n=1 Tax=Pleurotus eryngii TaxID=5323 RepID=A0A9P6D0F0_PLEER|nr:hypothetical protein BDN71DRAFT_1513914 [Pleurotus eryngii]